MNPTSDRAKDRAPRGGRRLKIFQPAALLHDGIAARIHLLDVSATGALCHGRTPRATGERVTLECAGLRLTATVRWSDGKRFGLVFERPLSALQLEAIAALGRVAAPSPAAPPREG